MATERQRLIRRWLHAHEEDTGEQMVFRPAEAELPPSRGRRALELHEDGSAIASEPGPVDRPEVTEADWRVTDDDKLVIRDSAGKELWAGRILAAEPDRLVLDKRSMGLA